MKHKIVVFDEAYTLFHFNIILRQNGIPVLKKYGGSTFFDFSYNEGAHAPGSKKDRGLQRM